MSEQVTDGARRVILLARQEAELFKHDYLGTEHLLLGLIRENDGIAARALRSLGISLDGVRDQVRMSVGEGRLPISPDRIPFTPRAGEALALALREARKRGQDRADTEHILIGLTRLAGDNAADMLASRLGVDMSDVRRAVDPRP